MLAKKLISFFLLPFPVGLLLVMAGAVVLWFTSRQRAGKILASAGAGILLIFSWAPTSQWLLAPLHRIGRLADPAADAAGARFVVVLGGGYETTPAVPPTSRLSGATLERLVEGIRVYRRLPGAKLILSGGGGGEGIPSEAQMMVEAAEVLGAPPADTIQEGRSDDTQDEAVLVHDLVGNARVVLVTSAVHMRRSIKLFEKQGMTVVPAPAGYWPDRMEPLPDSERIAECDAASHEYVGMLWARLRGTM